MKRQELINGANISDGVIGARAVWQGGHGWLVVPTFTSTGPVMNVTMRLSPNETIPNVDLPATISAAGVYPFWAPEGVLIDVDANVSPGDSLAFNAFLVGDRA